LLFPYNKTEKIRFQTGKRALELLGVPHDVGVENVILDKNETKALLINLGFDKDYNKELQVEFDFKNYNEKTVLNCINELSKFEIKDKAGEFIGSRMGRPEKAKLRKLTGSPSVLFPIGEEGGRLRSANEAFKKGFVKAEFPFYYCKKCDRETIYRVCEICSERTEQKYYCKMCKSEINTPECREHKIGSKYKPSRIDMQHYFEIARGKLDYLKTDIPPLIKGIRGTSSENHDMENFVKGILRAKYNLCVNKDGTIRYDMTELPVSHFKPQEVEVSVDKLKELGYTKDHYGKELVNEHQILELKPHDIIIPCNNLAGDEKADDVFINVSKFIDELLVKFYNLPAFYNVEKRSDLIGKLCVCMAPHNCAGVIGRIIGFSKVQGLFASPYMHAAMRRDCVYPTTKFVYSKDNIIKNSSIGDFVENLIKQGNKKREIDGYGTEKIELSDNEKNLYAFGVNPKTKKLVKKKIKYFIKGKSPKKWIKIKTSSGREQIMTPRHKFIYLDKDNNFQIKQASEIKKGDRFAVLKNFNLKEKEIKEIFLPEFLSENVPIEKQKEIRIIDAGDFFKKIISKNGERKIRELLKISLNSLHDWYNLVPLNHVKKLIDLKLMNWKELPKQTKIRTIFNAKKWDLDLKIDKNLIGILGYYSAEGYSRQNKTVSQISFRIMDKIQKNKLVSCIKNSFGLKSSLGEDETKITICNKLVYYLFKYCFCMGDGAYKKQVPNILYNVSDKLVKEYLSTYFDGDGTIVKGKGNFVCFYSVSRELLDGVSLLGERFGIFGRFYNTKERLPGKKVLERYAELGKSPKKHILQHLVYSGKDFYKIIQILKPVNKHKLEAIKSVSLRTAKERKIKFENKYFILEKLGDVVVDIIKNVEIIKDKKNSYCLEIDWKSDEDKNILWGEQIINFRCDGDEAAMMLLLDVLINFSRKFLPSHRGGTQDAPLVLNGQINANEVDDQILDFELVEKYPLELYEKAEQKLHSGEISIEMVKQRIARGEDPFIHTGFTHDTENFNFGATCSSYKTLPTMKEKVGAQMLLCQKLRSVNQGDVARLIIDRHFIRDLKGNLRKFSQQNFRCGKCNTIYRRPPLNGKCEKCGNSKLIFTIAYGSIVKYLEPALDLTKEFDVPLYVIQDLELTKKYIESIFGKETEKQENMDRWF
jgi:DNA polymerase II large subunit